LLSKANTMLNLYTYLCKTLEFVSKTENMLRCVVVYRIMTDFFS
jgi:hypothetical protein